MEPFYQPHGFILSYQNVCVNHVGRFYRLSVWMSNSNSEFRIPNSELKTAPLSVAPHDEICYNEREINRHREDVFCI